MFKFLRNKLRSVVVWRNNPPVGELHLYECKSVRLLDACKGKITIVNADSEDVAAFRADNAYTIIEFST